MRREELGLVFEARSASEATVAVRDTNGRQLCLILQHMFNRAQQERNRQRIAIAFRTFLGEAASPTPDA